LRVHDQIKLNDFHVYFVSDRYRGKFAFVHFRSVEYAQLAQEAFQHVILSDRSVLHLRCVDFNRESQVVPDRYRPNEQTHPRERGRDRYQRDSRERYQREEHAHFDRRRARDDGSLRAPSAPTEERPRERRRSQIPIGLTRSRSRSRDRTRSPPRHSAVSTQPAITTLPCASRSDINAIDTTSSLPAHMRQIRIQRHEPPAPQPEIRLNLHSLSRISRSRSPRQQAQNFVNPSAGVASEFASTVTSTVASHMCDVQTMEPDHRVVADTAHVDGDTKAIKFIMASICALDTATR
jgi:hypothetical protein